MYLLRPYELKRHDRTAQDFVGIIGIEGDVLYNRYGDVCAILQLTALNSDRIDPSKVDIIEERDRTFLNSLPCKIQIVKYTYDYNMDRYFDRMLATARKLPNNVQKYLIAHLDFYQKYCDSVAISDPEMYLIAAVDSGTANPIEQLDINTGIIQANLVGCGVLARRLISDEISDVVIKIMTGIGETGLGYVSPYVEVNSHETLE